MMSDDDEIVGYALEPDEAGRCLDHAHAFCKPLEDLVPLYKWEMPDHFFWCDVCASEYLAD